MSSNIKKAVKSKSKTTATEFRKKTKDGKDVRISVEEISNGYLVIRSTEWNDPKKGWQYETQKLFSPTNPLEFDPDESLADSFK